MPTDEQLRCFVENGWVVLPNAVPPEVLDAVDDEVDRLVEESPPARSHVGHHFYWQTSAASPALFEPLGGPEGLVALARALVGDRGVEVAFDQAQVALNIPPYRHRPGRPHLDGYASGQAVPGSFTLLAGLMLTDQTKDNSGNLWVWPGTHLTDAAFFAANGAGAFAAAGGYPDIELPEPTQVHGRRGDVLLAHYLLGHNIGSNYQIDRTRRMIYWRLRVRGHTDRWAACLTDPWLDYERLRHVVPERERDSCRHHKDG